MTIFEALKGQEVNTVLQSLFVDAVWKQTIGAIRIGLGLSADDSVSTITAEQVANVCSRAGYNTVEELTTAITSGRLDFIKLSERKPIIKTTEQVNHDTIRDAIQRSKGYKASPNVRWYQKDMSYHLLTEDDLNEILLYTPDLTKQYRATVNDCDDFQKQYLGWLASKGLGNVSIGFCSTLHLNGGVVKGSHAACFVVYRKKDGTIVANHLEPMNGRLTHFSDLTIGGFWLAPEVQVYEIGV